jgi:signal transduction histidine kinase
MPVLIIRYFNNKRGIIKFQRVYVLFASFILLCGSTHFLDAMMFWIPMYRFNALVRLLTGIVSLFTVYHLIKILPEVFKQKTNIELENEISRRVEAENKLDEVNKNLEAFAYVASHDLQEPLRKIRMYTTMLYNSNESKFDDASKGFANKVIGSSERMQTMIKDILALSTVNDDVEITEVSPNDAVKKALEDLEIKILERHAIINVDELPKVKGNEVYLAQLFMNLIGNAIKFSKDQPVVNIRGEVSGENVSIYVQDNGIGMNEKDSDKIFNAFYKVHRRGEYEGSGIGLSICKKIVDLFNGNIHIKSKVGEGTTFIIELPKAESSFNYHE